MDLQRLFDEPKLISLVGDINTGKSNLLYWIIQSLQEKADFDLYYFGLRNKLESGIEISSVEELELCKNSIIILDEVMTLFDLENRKEKQKIENTLRHIHHNNNILLLSMLPENCKKFISSKIQVAFYKRSTIPDFINGSMTKRQVTSYMGKEKGSVMLDLAVNEALVYDGLHWEKIEIPYIENFDTKKNNENILKAKS